MAIQSQVDAATSPPQLRRRWLRFSLRTFFVVLTALCVWLGIKVNQARRQKEAVEALGNAGATIHFAHERSGEGPIYAYDSQNDISAPDWLRDLAGDDFFQTAVSLRFIRPVTDDDLVHLEGLPYIEQLDLDDRREVTDAGLAYLPRPDRLVVFSGYHTSIGDEFVKRLASADRLTMLSLDGTRVTDKGLGALRGLTQLQSLSLADTAVTDAGLDALREMPSLSLLQLDGTRITEKTLSYLKDAIKVRGLYLRGTAVTDEGLRYLTKLKRLATIVLSKTKVTGEGLKYLADFPLEDIDLSGCPVEGGSLLSIKSFKPAAGSLGLILADTRINNDDIRFIAQLGNLGGIALDHTQITDEGLRHVARLKHLQALALNGTKITDAGLKHLHGMPKLTSVQLQGTAVTQQGVAALKKATSSLRAVFTDNGVK